MNLQVKIETLLNLWQIVWASIINFSNYWADKEIIFNENGSWYSRWKYVRMKIIIDFPHFPKSKTPITYSRANLWFFSSDVKNSKIKYYILIKKMIGAQWTKHWPRVKFKDTSWDPHTAESDGGIHPNNCYIYTFEVLLRNTFYKFLETKFKQVFTIRRMIYNNKYSDYSQFGDQRSKPNEQLLDTCCRKILTTLSN
jgi:hypothetical protein